MLEIISQIICATIMAFLGFYIVKVITKSDEKITDIKNLFLLLILILVPSISYNKDYSSIFTFIVYLVNIMVYKRIFKINLIQTIILSSMLMIITFFADILVCLSFIPFVTINELRGWSIQLVANLILAIICIIFINIPKVRCLLQKIYIKLDVIRNIPSTLFAVFSMIAFTVLEYNFSVAYGWNNGFILNILVTFIFFILICIFINERNANEMLLREYEDLFNYVQNFEEWIEKEQLNRHEYKNQLAVLRILTKEKKVRQKVDEILDDSINIEGEIVNHLKLLPKGGIKGLMYYKTIVAQKKKVHLTVDVCLEKNTYLKKLSQHNIKVLCQLIGIYFDNAIEAAEETRKKDVLVEIYELDDYVKLVFSNTFKNNKFLENRNEKGVTSKGKGHGNGLYFASKLINKNAWISGRQEIIDGYYIQSLVIQKDNKKKLS